MKKDKKFKWNVYVWNVNRDEIEVYDVVPYLKIFYRSEKNKPKTKEQFDKFLDSAARYLFWAKCEYEVIVHNWPKFKNDAKIDVYMQLKLNWDVFVDRFWKEISKKNAGRPRRRLA